MPEFAIDTDAATAEKSVADQIAEVCKRIPPLWDLPNYVAVNPFLGFADRPIAETAAEMRDTLRARVLPDLAYYQERWRKSGFGRVELAAAAGRAGMETGELVEILTGRKLMPMRPSQPFKTYMDAYDLKHRSKLKDAVTRSISRWCSVFVTGGGSCWALPETEEVGLYTSWKEAASVDRTLEILGVRGWRRFIKELPTSPEAAIEAALHRMGIPSELRVPYLYHLLGALYGWASFFRRESWEQGNLDAGSLIELLAILVVSDAAVAAIDPAITAHDLPSKLVAIEDEVVRMVFQEAVEDAYTTKLLGSFRTADSPRSKQRPAFQAVFCIDVRSEPIRYHLELHSQAIETRGFAGFFGISLDLIDEDSHSSRCPVLLKPGLAVRCSAKQAGHDASKALKHLQSSPGSSFSFVELCGIAYGIGMAGDALAAVPTRLSKEGREAFAVAPLNGTGGISLDDRVKMASGMLKNMGFRETFARVILLCGHEGRSANNSHAAGLHCGACGGHSGAINARVAAAVLNDPSVRAELEPKGWTIPPDTWFVPGVHDTSTDEVSLLDAQLVPKTHASDIDELKRLLASSGEATRSGRAAALGLDPRQAGALPSQFERRARDWSEVRPEWALARNAAFIAARRDRTRGVNLDGRAFLTEYDCNADPDNSILTLILTAPMVVGSWINLQYFASTVDNDFLGAGNKSIHNRVGTHGVVLGNGGDLRTGLPLQSVHQPNGHWYHEPLRLQVVVEAEPERIEAVLQAEESVRNLVENGWVRLFSLNPRGDNCFRWVPGQGWVSE